MKLRTTSLLIISLITAGLTVTAGAPASAAQAPRGAAVTDAFFPSGDGTMLHAEVALPAEGCDTVVNTDGTTGCPVIVSMGPYFGSGTQGTPITPFGLDLGYGSVNGDAIMSARFFDFFAYDFDTDDDGVGDTNIFEMGYAVVQVDSRGFGSSGGCNDYGGYGEQMDMAASVTWAGTQSWSNGKVGTWGKSYDAWTQVMGLAENPPHLEAAIIQAPIIDGYGIAYVNGVHHDAGWYATTNLYALYDYVPNSVNEEPEGHVHATGGVAGYNPNNNGVGTPACWAQQNAEVLNPDRSWYFWTERDLRPRAAHNDDVAVFWTHGFTDVQTKPDQVFGVYDGLTDRNGDDTRAWFGQWDHIRGSDQVTNADREDEFPHEDWQVGRAGWNEEVLDWLNHYLRGEDFVYEVNDDNLVEVQDNEGAWRTETTYPNREDLRRIDFPISGGTYSDRNTADDVGRFVDVLDGYWTVSPPATGDFRITGEPTVTIDATITAPRASFAGILYDIAPDGTAAEISRTAILLEGSGPYTVTAHPADWILREGHRLAYRVTSDHEEFFPHSTGQTVTVNGGTITIPTPAFEREVNLGGQRPSRDNAFFAEISEAEIAAAEVEFDMDAFETSPVHGNAQRKDLQGDLHASRPFE